MSGKKIREAREKAGLTSLALAERLGISHSTINRIENDDGELSKSRLMEIARMLGISPIDLFEETELKVDGVDFFEKYGKVESSYIRFILGQNELLRQQLSKCLHDQERLMEHLKRQDEFLRQFTAYLKTQKKRGGGVENSNSSGFFCGRLIGLSACSLLYFTNMRYTFRGLRGNPQPPTVKRM